MKLEDLHNEKSRNGQRNKPEKIPKGKKVKGYGQKKEKSLSDVKATYYKVAMTVCIIGLLGTTGSLIWYYSQMVKADKVFAQYAPSDAEDSSGEIQKITYVDIQGVNVWDRYADSYIKNHDCIGWITIPGTKIDYPVAYSVDEPEYYLHRNLDKEYSFGGTIFADSEADMNTLSNNVVLYGHHMRNGSMFAGLEEYDKEDFWKDHKIITFDTINGHYAYEVISAFRINANHEFKYASFNIAENDKEIDDWISQVLERSYFKESTAERQDKFITLSTCDYYQRNGRFVVVAKQIESSDAWEKEYITLDEYNQRKNSNQGKEEGGEDNGTDKKEVN